MGIRRILCPSWAIYTPVSGPDLVSTTECDPFEDWRLEEIFSEEFKREYGPLPESGKNHTPLRAIIHGGEEEPFFENGNLYAIDPEGEMQKFTADKLDGIAIGYAMVGFPLADSKYFARHPETIFFYPIMPGLDKYAVSWMGKGYFNH